MFVLCEIQQLKKKLHLSEKERLEQELAETENNASYINEQFSTIQEEIASKTKKLKQLWKKYMEKKEEIADLEEENGEEEEELLSNIRQLTKQFQLKSVILEHFIPQK